MARVQSRSPTAPAARLVRLVLPSPQACHELAPEESPPGQGLRPQEVPQGPGEWPEHPVGDGHSHAGLGPADDVTGEVFLQYQFQDVLLAGPMQLHLRRQPEGVLGQLPVEERRADVERPAPAICSMRGRMFSEPFRAISARRMRLRNVDAFPLRR